MNKQRGFTLIELLVVIGILAILMAFAAPSMVQWRDSARIKGVASDILSGLRQARSLAITTNQAVTTVIDIAQNQLEYEDSANNPIGTAIVLSSNVGLETRIKKTDAWSATNGANTDNRKTIFRSNGSCDNELYVMVNGDNNLIIAIDSTASGLARL